MEEDRIRHAQAQPSDKSSALESGPTVDGRMGSSPQIEKLSDVLGWLSMGLDWQATVSKSHDVKRLPENLQDFLDENLHDLEDLERRIDTLLQPSIGHVQIGECLTWLVPSALLQAMFNLSTHREIGAAFMQFVDELRPCFDLTDISETNRLQEHLKNLMVLFKKIVMIEKDRKGGEQSESNEYEVKLLKIQKKVLKEMENVHYLSEKYTRSKSMHLRLVSTISSKEIFRLFAPELYCDDNKTQIKINIDLYSSAVELSSALRGCSWKIGQQQAIGYYCKKIITDQINELVCLARALKYSCKQHEKNEIEKAVREVLFQTLNLFDVSDIVVRENMKMFAANSTNLRLKLRQSKVVKQSEHPRHSSSGLPVVGHGKFVPEYTARSPSPPRYDKFRQAVVGAGGGGAVGTVAGAVRGGVVGTTASSISSATSMLAAGPAGAAVESAALGVVGGSLWHRFVEQEVETELRPTVASASHAPLECVATPFSDPVYLKAGGGNRGGCGGGDDDDVGGGDGGGDEGGDRGGDGHVTPNPEYTRRYLDACRSLTEAINDLCRITSQINGIQNDCREMLQKLESHEAMLECGQPTSALSYAECIQELTNQRETIVLLNNEQPMARIVFFRTLRFIISAVCKTLDLAAQCAYLLTLKDSDLEAASVGVVDYRHLKKTVATAQFTCYKMLQFSPELARQEVVKLREEIAELLSALAAANRRSLNMKKAIHRAKANVHNSADELNSTLQLDNRETISTAIIQLLNNIKRVGALAEDPDIVPIAANMSCDAQERRTDVLNSAKNLYEKATILVQDAMVHENIGDTTRPLTWATGSDVAREFQELLVAVRKNGRSAGFIEDIQTDV